ncbi:hypothetical protein [Oscillibacter sp.]|uniref:hypothetical protein n=1 Tax=Oscillibacter sp. TaxID=1945593 RepID=UPI002D80B0BB|nr:hypothetical protein [Oscillibacter sp.]
MRVTCGNQFCIYWSDDACTLERIDLDDQGGCIDCMPIKLSEEFLARKRKELLDELARREARWQEEGKA